MRKVKKSFNNPPPELLNNNLHEVIDPSHMNYRRTTQGTYAHPQVVAKLKKIYNSKCAYCETFVSEPEIDHYRPKGRVTGVKDHPGYFWLCYEWSNLLPACHECNKQGAKGNHFPIDGLRQSAPIIRGGQIDLTENTLTSNSLSLEMPLILNPENPGYDPFDYFKIDSEGTFLPKADKNTPEYKRAIETIQCLQLNRDKLKLVVRKRAILYKMRKIKSIMYKYLNSRISVTEFENEFLTLLREIKDQSRPSLYNEYWFFWNYLLKNFKSFLASYFKMRFRILLFETYDVLINRVS